MAEARTIARPYAEAVFRLAQARGQLAPWSRRLQLLAALVSDARLARLIADPRIARPRLIALLLELAGGELGAAGENIVRLLAENRRLGLLPEIAELYEALRIEAEARVDAQVRTAFALSDAEQATLTQALKRRLGREVKLSVAVDRTLLGGVVIRAGDLVIDGSVRGRLAALSTHLGY